MDKSGIREEGNLVVVVAKLLGDVKLTAEQEKALKLEPGWREKLPHDFLQKVAEVIDRNKDVLRDLKHH